MTLSEELSTLRETLAEYTPISRYEDSYLYSIWIRERAKVLSTQKKFSSWMYHRFCIGLETSKAHDCSCVTVGCDIKRSVFKIPKAVSGKIGDLFELYTFNNERIGITTAFGIKSDMQDPVKSKRMRAVIYNQKIEVYNASSNLKGLLVNGVWEDLLSWNEIQLCTETNPCEDIYNLEMGLPADISKTVLEQCLRTLGFSLNKLNNEGVTRNTQRP